MGPLRVLILTQHFAPEVTAGRFRLEAFAEALLARGHTVDVVTAVPNHPKGIVEPEFRGRLWFDERRPGLSVRRVAIYARPEKTAAKRLGSYGSFLATASLAGAVSRRPDIVLASSPPLTVGAAGSAVAARHRAPLVFDVRDLWPESAVALGELGPGRVLRAAERLERHIYRRSRMIVTANDAFSAYVAERAPASVPVETVPNGTTAAWMRAGEIDGERASVGLPEDRFVLAYAGNLGLAQAVDAAVDALGQLPDGFRLEIIGEGPRREELREAAAKLPPGAVGFRDLVEPEEAARILRASDALLVAERQDKTVSAKLYDYSAIGRPIVAIARGEMQRIVEREGIALHVALDDAAGVAEALRRLRADPALGEGLAARARQFAAEHLRARQAERLAALLEAV